MGIFDALTGKAAKDAAAKNTALYNQYQTEGLGELNTGMANAIPELDKSIGAWSPLSDLGTKYGAGTNLYMDALGINGAGGNTNATQAFQASPGYNWARDQAIEATARNANRFGAGGNEIAAVTDRANNLANQEYGNWMTRLGGFVNPELQATSTAAGGKSAGYGAKAGAYGADAQNRVNVRSNVASGIAGSNTSSANAQTAASSNFWTGLMNLGGAALGGKKTA